MDTNQKYVYFMDHVYGIGAKNAGKLLSVFDSPAEAYTASGEQLERILGKERGMNFVKLRETFHLDAEYARLKERGISFYHLWGEGYPEKLKEIPDPPMALYVKGKLPCECAPSVAVIGARSCSAYGREVAREIGIALGLAGIQVISGMAMGIDGIAQKGALSAGGDSYAVLGCGVDICYPERHRDLYEELQEKGGVISGYLPGTLPKAELFPPRNRIISGLSDGVIVVEAGAKSGTLITVDMALEQGREVFCVPGRISDRLSGGCNRLIEAGAHMILSVDTLIEKLTEVCSLKSIKSPEQTNKEADSMDKIDKSMSIREKEVYERLDIYPVSGEQIFLSLASESLYNWTFQEVLQTLWELVLRGAAECRGGGYYMKKSSY